MNNNELTLIKSLIKKAIALLGSSGAKITLSNADDCSLFISNLFGYRDWKDVRDKNSIVKEGLNLEFDNLLESNLKNIKDFSFESRDLVLKKLHYSDLFSSISPVKLLTKSDIDFGVSEDSILKIESIEKIKFTKTVIVSEHNNSDLKDLTFNNGMFNPCITFSENPNVQLDPWAIIIGTNALEKFFNKVPGSFSSIFVSLLRDLQLSGFSVELKELLNLLEIKNLMSLLPILKELNLSSYFSLSSFFKKMKIQINDGFIVTESIQIKYLSEVADVYRILTVMSFFYQEGVFKKLYSEDNLLKSMETRQNITISNKFLSHPLYLDFVKIAMERSFDIYESSVKNNDNYYYWVYINGFEDFSGWDLSWLNKYSVFSVLIETSPNAKMLSNVLEDSNQILLGKMSSFKVSDNLKNFWLDLIPDWPERFWFNGCEALSTIGDDEYFYINTNHDGDLNKEFKRLNCVKIKLLKK